MATDAPAPLMVDDDAGLADLLARLDNAPHVAIDTESNSMHAYFERVCLVQVSVPGLDALVDALAVDIGPMAGLFADPEREKVFHGADYDVLCLKRAFGFSFENLFDTMLAARVLGWERYGLAAILEEHFGFAADKRFQRYDWGRRPISPEAIAYARHDTHYLLALRDLQWHALQERDRVDECVHACERQARVEPRIKEFDPDDFWRIKGVKDLDELARTVLRALFVFRDELARKLDRPPFRVMNDGVMVYLARKRPSTRDELAGVKGVPRPILSRNGRALLDTIARAGTSEAPPPRRPERVRTPKEVAARFEKLRAWRKTVAESLGVEPDIVMGKASLMAVATANPVAAEGLAAIPEVDAWERDRYGEGLLAALRE
jgi:ribonuclease D